MVVGKLMYKCITVAAPILSPIKQTACLLVLDIVDVIYCLNRFYQLLPREVICNCYVLEVITCNYYLLSRKS